MADTSRSRAQTWPYPRHQYFERRLPAHGQRAGRQTRQQAGQLAEEVRHLIGHANRKLTADDAWVEARVV